MDVERKNRQFFAWMEYYSIRWSCNFLFRCHIRLPQRRNFCVQLNALRLTEWQFWKSLDVATSRSRGSTTIRLSEASNKSSIHLQN